MHVFRLLLVTACCCTALTSWGQEWTRFRGPNGTGESEAKGIPTEWTEKDVLWKASIPGMGHASPVVWGDRVFTFSANPDDATRYCLCYRVSDGKELWRKEFKSEVHHLHPRSSFASSTPAVDNERVYFTWSTPKETIAIAFDHDGKEVWRKDLGRWVGQHGFGSSPIVYENLLIVNNAQDDERGKANEQPGKSFMTALDKKTGEEIWNAPLNAKVVSYSVPFIHELENGKAEVICSNSGNGIFGIDAASGKMTWSVPDCLRMRTVSSPILAAGLVFGSCGSGAYSDNTVVAVRPGADAKVEYELKNSGKMKAPYVPCLVKHGELLFLLYDKGFAACVDAGTGKVHWFERTNAAFSGSPVRVGDRIFCIDEEGVVWVFAADKEYKLLAKNPLGEPSRSTPAVADGKMYLRTYSQLICVGQR